MAKEDWIPKKLSSQSKLEPSLIEFASKESLSQITLTFKISNIFYHPLLILYPSLY